MYLADSMAVTTIPVTDLEQTKSFYRDTLGLTLLEETPFALRWGAGQTQIHHGGKLPVRDANASPTDSRHNRLHTNDSPLRVFACRRTRPITTRRRP